MEWVVYEVFVAANVPIVGFATYCLDLSLGTTGSGEKDPKVEVDRFRALPRTKLRKEVSCAYPYFI